MKISPLTSIAKTCADFLCANKNADVIMVQEHILTSLSGSFNTILFGEEKEFVLSDQNGFTEPVKSAILYRINLKENRSEFLNLLFKEISQSCISGLIADNNWSITKKITKLY